MPAPAAPVETPPGHSEAALQPGQGTDPLRVILWGSYDLGKPRTRILRDGLVETGVTVTEIHADIWNGIEDKSTLSTAQVLWAGLRLLLAYPLLIWRYLRADAHDLVLVPYLGQLDVLVLWPFAALRRKRVVWDMFLSLHDSVVNDRRIAPRWSIRSGALWILEWMGTRAADLVLMDTPAHARHVTALFGLRSGKVSAVPVGVETAAFPRLAARNRGPGVTRLLFYGQMSPLHGVATILAAALSNRGRGRQWTIVGSGPEAGLLKASLSPEKTPHVAWLNWVPYARLGQQIGDADICLGVFGTSDKAASVVPNKVYQCLASGRPVISRDGPAMREAFGSGAVGLELVPPGDPEALLDAVERIEAAGFPAPASDLVPVLRSADVAQSFLRAVAPLMQGKTA